MKKRLIIGMSGASGAALTVEVLQQLRKYEAEIERHLVVTECAKLTLAQETDVTPEQLQDLADVFYENDCMDAAIASGSFRSMGMIVVPCSMKTLAGIVSGYSDNLLLRACDVTLKERRKLVVVPREAPLGTIHLRNMYELSQLGAVILPPVISCYQKPETLQDCVRHIAGKILDQFDLECDGYIRWGED